jgi:hypothetical protein
VRVLVCGSRDFNDYRHLSTMLDYHHKQHNFTVVIEGGARGADTMAREWAESRGIPVEEYPADWEKYGRAAGPIRNKQMLTEGEPAMVIAFPKTVLIESKGTKNMVMQAQKAGLLVIIE